MNWQGPGRYTEPVPPDTTDLPPLPKGWAWATMPQLGDLNRGKSKHRPRDDARLYGGPYPFIQTGDVRKSGGTIREHSQTYSAFGLQQSRLWPEGTLCITIAANIAETGILTFPACFPDSVVGFTNNGHPATTRYVEFFIRTAKDKLAQFAPATAQKNINLDVLQKVAIPFPPLRQQVRIVAEIEKQFTRLEEGVAALRRVQANLKRYCAAVLKAACEGRLVPTEAELAKTVNRKFPFESGEALLAHILTERRKNWQDRGAYKEPAIPDIPKLRPLPEGWAWTTAQQLNLPNRPCAYGVLQPGADLPDGIPLVRVGDIADGRIDLSALKRISPQIVAQYPRTKLHGGELAITLVGAIGRTAIIPEDLAGGNTARTVGIIPLTKAVNAHWV